MERLHIGQEVYCSLHHAGVGYIYHIRGEQRPETVKSLMGGVGVMGGGAQFDIAFEDHCSLGISEALVRGSVQWKVRPNILTAEALAEKVQTAKAAMAQKAIAEQRARETRARRVERLRLSRCPLKKGDDQHGGKLAAENIRAELKARFPGVKFSVRCDPYRELRVSWTDGPTAKRVEKVTNKYRSSYFDGMEDIERSCVSVWNVVFGGAKYISCNRSHGDAAIAQAIDKVWGEWGWPEGLAKPTVEDFKMGRCWNVYPITGEGSNHWCLQSQVNRAMAETDITPPKKAKKQAKAKPCEDCRADWTAPTTTDTDKCPECGAWK